MKKKISIIVSAALFLAALAVFVCDNPKFDNPLDEKGTNFLEGRAKDSGFDVAGALTPDENGVAKYYTDTTYKRCDGTVPVVTLVGPKSVTINTQEVAAFRKWMHLDGGAWSELIKWGDGHKNVDAKKPRLTRGGGADVPYEDNKVPEPGANYVIVYKVEKPECNGKVPADETSRSLVIEQYVAPVTDTIRILLVGKPVIDDVKEGETGKYADDGVDVMFGSQNVTAEALDSVIIKRGSTVELRLKDKPIDFKKIVLSATAPAGSRYTITYYASKNGKSVNVTRTVNVAEASVVGLPDAVIVLNTYRHAIGGGKTIDYPDTMLYIGAKNSDYKEKGVKEVYYIKDGKKETISAALVEINPPSGKQSIDSTKDPAERKCNYRLPDGPGYKGATAQRSVFMVDNKNACAPSASAPTVTVTTKEINAGVPWDYTKGWSVKSNDVDDYPGRTVFNYLVDVGTLNPADPKAGQYQVTFVGLSYCGMISDTTVTITVK